MKVIYTILIPAAAMVTLYALDLVTPFNLMVYGIHPREAGYLPGILLAPFLHAGLTHLISNLVAFMPISAMICMRSTREFVWASTVIIIFSGMATWLVGRDANHIGSSGWVLGLWAYSIALGLIRKDIISILIAGVCLMFYGGMINSFIPRYGVSFELHLFGAISGIFAAYILDFDRKPREKN